MSSYNQMIFNYPLPDDWYPALQRQQAYHQSRILEDHIPRTFNNEMCIDPRQMLKSRSYDSHMQSPRMMTGTGSQHGRRSTMSVVVHQERKPQQSYTLEIGHSAPPTNRRGIGTMYNENGLPTPPLSPMSGSPTNMMSTIITSAASNSGPRHYCTHPLCLDKQNGRSTKSFSRHADLVRHERSIHAVLDEEGNKMPMYECPKPRCNRKGENGFTRHDHLMEHRRGYHKEDLPHKRSNDRNEDGAAKRMRATKRDSF